MQKTHSLQRGFVVAGLLSSIGFSALLFPIGFASYSQANASARDAKRKADLTTVRSALVLYYVDQGKYPVSGSGSETDNFKTVLTTLQQRGYISTRTINDPEGPGYRYTSTGSSFELCATLESAAVTDWCVNNP